MADKFTYTKYKTDDGLRAEHRFIERQDESGNKERVLETHVEQVPFVIAERVVEKVAPVITERRKETYSNGELIDTVIEQVSNSSLQLTVPVEIPDLVTKSDVEEIIRKVLSEIIENQANTIDEPEEVVPPEIAEVIPPEPVKSSWSSWLDIGLYVILAGQLAFIVYQGFLKGLIER